MTRDGDRPEELTPEQRLELLQAEYSRMRLDLHRTIELLEYYRSQVDPPHARDRPPAGFWIRRTDRATVWGMLVDGDLVPKGKTDVYEEAVDECWAHYDKLHGRQA